MPSASFEPWPDVDHDTAAVAALARGGPEFAELNAAQRRLQDRLAGAALPPDVAREVTERLRELTDVLDRHQVPERDRHDWRPDLPGRGLALLPPYVIDAEDTTTLRGRVTFTRFFLGGNGAAHGGSQPLLFDDVLGMLMNHGRAGVARTAFLKVDFRRVTPVDVELTFVATVDRIEGRKRWGSARLVDPDGTVLAEAEGLFVQLRPGQP
jgi:acyl-coenzyme A thioesterase PaaI-like protein